MPLRLLAGSVGLWLLALVTASCGARSELPLPDVCPSEGEPRACADACGTGSQTCQSGVWSKCQVPVATRSCNDGCADGQESCADGRWQACKAPLTQRECSSRCGLGHETCNQGTWGSCDAPLPKPPKLKATVRDFTPMTNRDFEADYPSGVDRLIVEPTLGPDDKPVYAGTPLTPSTSGKASFDQWYNDTPGVNLSQAIDLQLVPSQLEPGLFEYVDNDFFPIDGELFGNGEFVTHNYHFTLEASTTFKYHGGEVFSFSGDDDMWVFINRKLAINLGGLHRIESDSVNIDDFAASAGMTLDNYYPLHFFFAERHTVESHFILRTSIADAGSCE